MGGRAVYNEDWDYIGEDVGCDIHATLEKYNSDEQRFVVVETNLDIDRNYELFAVMADVRRRPNVAPCVAQPRGLPSDAAYETRESYDRWSVDAHSASWLSREEVIEVGARVGDPSQNHLERLLLYRMAAIEEKDPRAKTRVVFWFDN